MAISKIENNSLASGVPSTAKLPAGTVLQVVGNSSSTQVSGNGAGTVLNLTALTTTITPTSATSKILVMPNLASYLNGNSAGFKLQVYRNGVAIYNPGQNYEVYQTTSGTPYMSDNYARQYWQILDSPATTSLVTYEFKLVLYASAIAAGINANNFYTSFITLMEIAA